MNQNIMNVPEGNYTLTVSFNKLSGDIVTLLELEIPIKVQKSDIVVTGALDNYSIVEYDLFINK